MTDAPSQSHPYPQPGEVIDDKYVVEKLLGEGAMGAVVRATHKLRRAPVALKFMSPAVMNMPGLVERFLNEGVAVSKIDSEHVVKVFDVSRLPSGVPYLVMEYLKGEDLSELLAREGRPHLEGAARAVHLVLQILRGLQVAHRAGIVHRDMKPANCFVTSRDDEPDFVKLLDFGISKMEQPDGLRLTGHSATMGTPLYMAPEQAMNPRGVDARCDLYAASVILYELLSGATPFVAESGVLSELFYKIFTTDPAPIQSVRRDLPPELCAVIHKGLAREPSARFQDAREMAEALAPFADERSAEVLRRLSGRRQAAASVGSLAPPRHDSLAPAPGQPSGQGALRSAVAAASTPPPAGSLAGGHTVAQGPVAAGTVPSPTGTADPRLGASTGGAAVAPARRLAKSKGAAAALAGVGATIALVAAAALALPRLLGSGEPASSSTGKPLATASPAPPGPTEMTTAAELEPRPDAPPAPSAVPSAAPSDRAALPSEPFLPVAPRPPIPPAPPVGPRRPPSAAPTARPASTPAPPATPSEPDPNAVKPMH